MHYQDKKYWNIYLPLETEVSATSSEACQPFLTPLWRPITRNDSTSHTIPENKMSSKKNEFEKSFTRTL